MKPLDLTPVWLRWPPRSPRGPAGRRGHRPCLPPCVVCWPGALWEPWPPTSTRAPCSGGRRPPSAMGWPTAWTFGGVTAWPPCPPGRWTPVIVYMGGGPDGPHPVRRPMDTGRETHPPAHEYPGGAPAVAHGARVCHPLGGNRPGGGRSSTPLPPLGAKSPVLSRGAVAAYSSRGGDNPTAWPT